MQYAAVPFLNRPIYSLKGLEKITNLFQQINLLKTKTVPPALSIIFFLLFPERPEFCAHMSISLSMLQI